jgi:hypothetical protein
MTSATFDCLDEARFFGWIQLIRDSQSLACYLHQCKRYSKRIGAVLRAYGLVIAVVAMVFGVSYAEDSDLVAVYRPELARFEKMTHGWSFEDSSDDSLRRLFWVSKSGAVVRQVDKYVRANGVESIGHYSCASQGLVFVASSEPGKRTIERSVSFEKFESATAQKGFLFGGLGGKGAKTFSQVVTESELTLLEKEFDGVVYKGFCCTKPDGDRDSFLFDDAGRLTYGIGEYGLGQKIGP